MEFHIQRVGASADIALLREAIQAEDPSALVDMDPIGAEMRVATSIAMGELVALLNKSGHPISEQDVTQVPSICCGGCGG